MRCGIKSCQAILFVCLMTTQAPAQLWNVELFDKDARALGTTRDSSIAQAVEFTPDGKTVVTAGGSYTAATKTLAGELMLRDVRDGSVIAQLRGDAEYFSARSGTLAINRMGTLIAVVGQDQKQRPKAFVDLFDVSARKHVHTLRGEEGSINCVVFSPDEKTLAVAKSIKQAGKKWKGQVELWDPHTGKLLRSFLASDTGLRIIAYSPDGKLLATGNYDAGVALWNPINWQKVAAIPQPRALKFIAPLAFSPDGRLLAAGGNPSAADKKSPIVVWEISTAADKPADITAEPYAELVGHRGYVGALVFSPDGRLLASVGQDQTVRMWDPHTNRDLTSITAHQDEVYDVAFSPDGKLLATLGRDSLKLWSVEELRKK